MGLRIGGASEFAGWSRPPSSNYRVGKTCKGFTSRILYQQRAQDGWASSKPPEALPVIGFSPRCNAWPTAGRLLADMVAERAPTTNLTPFPFFLIWSIK